MSVANKKVRILKRNTQQIIQYFLAANKSRCEVRVLFKSIVIKNVLKATKFGEFKSIHKIFRNNH